LPRWTLEDLEAKWEYK